jgi:hypothetical protein
MSDKAKRDNERGSLSRRQKVQPDGRGDDAEGKASDE